MFRSPATPPLPSSPGGRIGHHLLLQYLFSWTGGPQPALVGRALGSSCGSQPTGVAETGSLQHPFGSPRKHLSFGGPDFAGPAVSSAPVSLPVTAGGLSPKKPIASPPAATDVLPPMPGQGVHIASSVEEGALQSAAGALGHG